MSELIVSRQQRVLLLTLNRPAARNALNNALLMQLVNELEAAATDTSISVCVITGNARFFNPTVTRNGADYAPHGSHQRTQR